MYKKQRQELTKRVNEKTKECSIRVIELEKGHDAELFGNRNMIQTTYTGTYEDLQEMIRDVKTEHESISKVELYINGFVLTIGRIDTLAL